MDGLGTEVRKRITFATLGGAFGIIGFREMGAGGWISAALFLGLCFVAMWLATRSPANCQ